MAFQSVFGVLVGSNGFAKDGKGMVWFMIPGLVGEGGKTPSSRYDLFNEIDAFIIWFRDVS